MRKFKENLGYKGHLEVYKRFSDGEETLLFSDHNIVVSGMGVGLSRFFGGDGSPDLSAFTLGYYQVGVSGASGVEVESTFELSGALSSVDEYEEGNPLFKDLYQIKDGVPRPNNIFGPISQSKIVHYSPGKILVRIILDEEHANNIRRGNTIVPLTEIGLFMKNPRNFTFNGNKQDFPILVAYKNFDGIIKSEGFARVFKWLITLTA